MKIGKWLWGLWGAMVLSMMLRRQADTYMLVALIVIPILVVLLDLHEEIASLKEENKHQRKFVMDRYNVLLEKMKDVSSQVEKRLVVDFAEFAKSNPPEEDRITQIHQRQTVKTRRKLKKRKKSEVSADTENYDLTQIEPQNDAPLIDYDQPEDENLS